MNQRAMPAPRGAVADGGARVGGRDDTGRRSTVPRPPALDIAMAGAALVVLGPAWPLTGGLSGSSVGLAIAALAATAMALAVAWRRTEPVPSAAVIYAAALAHFATGTPFMPADLLILLALYSVTAYGPRWAQFVGLGGALLGSAMQSLYFAVESGIVGRLAVVDAAFVLILTGGLVLAAWSLGLVRRARVERAESVAERAARLEVERDQQAQIAIAAERARIAREMHDIVAHSLSVVIAQADGGRYAAANDPEAAERALETIAESGRTALGDLRRILGVLREGDDGDDLTPQPDEHSLDSLIAHVRETGLKVSLVTMGAARALPGTTGLAVYRIVQESLTNVLKHGGPQAQATVLVQWGEQSLTVVVEDNGHGAAAMSDGGHGLVGMRERATMLGGDLNAGPRPGGGWRVRATIPLTLPRT